MLSLPLAGPPERGPVARARRTFPEHSVTWAQPPLVYKKGVMKISRILPSLAVALVALTALVAAGCGGKDDVPADAVAVVDGTVITKARLDSTMALAKRQWAATKRAFPKTGTSEYSSLQAQAVASLVQREQLAQGAAELGIEVTPAEIDARLVEIAKQYYGGDLKQVTSQAKKQGYSEKDVRDAVEVELLQQGVSDKLTKSVSVSDADVKKYYDENKAQYTVAESRDVRHILVKTKAEADAVERRLASGEDFAALAKELSQDPGSASNGGKLTIQKGQTVAPFEKSSFTLKVDQISQPIKTQFGYHVIQALGPVKAASTTPLASAEAQIRAEVLKSKRDKAVQDWFAALQKSFKDKVTYKTGYAPPAAATDTGTNG